MKVSDLIKKLEEVQQTYGDHVLTTYDGFVYRIDFTPAKDGVSYPLEKGEHDELAIEIFTRDDRP